MILSVHRYLTISEVNLNKIILFCSKFMIFKKVISMIKSKFNLEGCRYELLTLEKLQLAESESLDQHGFGSLFTVGNGMCLELSIVRPRSSRITRPRSARFPSFSLPKALVRTSGLRDSHPELEQNLLSLEEECSSIIFKVIDDAVNTSNRLQRLNEKLRNMTSGQLSAVENFVLSLEQKTPIDTNYLQKTVGPVYRRR